MKNPLQFIGRVISVLLGENLETPAEDAQGHNLEVRRYI